MKRGYFKLLYNQRNKNETIVSVIKRLFGEHIRSRLVRTQNREISFRCVAYNAHRLTNLSIIIDGFYKAIKSLHYPDQKGFTILVSSLIFLDGSLSCSYLGLISPTSAGKLWIPCCSLLGIEV